MKRHFARAAAGALVALSALGAAEIPVMGQASAAALARAPRSPASVDIGPPLMAEREPNNTPATAMPLGGNRATIKGYIVPVGDADYFSFAGNAGDRVYAATMTAGTPYLNHNSLLELIGVDGATVIESDDNDGSLSGDSSSIAGALLLEPGTFFLKVSYSPFVLRQLRPYVLYVRIVSGAPQPESEANGTLETADPLPASGWVSGVVGAPSDADFYSLTLDAGDTIFLSLDPNPERDHTTWNPQLGFAFFDGYELIVNDPSVEIENSEALFITVKKPGVYYPTVRYAASLTPSTYHLSAAVFPRPVEVCTPYSSSESVLILPLTATVSAVSVGDGPPVGRLRVSINLTHTNMPDLDVTLRDPQGDEIGLFTDIGSGAITGVDMTLDDDAAVPAGSFPPMKNLVYRPEAEFLLAWNEGQPRRGTWELVVRSDGDAASGELQGWSLEICDPPPSACGPGSGCVAVYTTTFESGADGFVMAGVQNEWARGLPSAYPITSCQSGSNCFKTDLDGAYNANSSQDLFSPPINLTGYLSPAIANWGMKYSLETATFDHAWVEIQEVGGSFLTRTLWMHHGTTMSLTVGGGPAVSVQEAAGWGAHTRDISDFVGKIVRLRFHLDSDSSVNLSGLAIDDVEVWAMPRLAYLPRVVR